MHVVPKVELEKVHFCKSNKVKYRKHLTVGVLVSSACTIIGVAFNIPWLTHMAVGANTITSLMWIWE